MKLCNIDCTLQCDVTHVVKTDLYLLAVSPWVALNSTCDNLGHNHHRTATDPLGNQGRQSAVLIKTMIFHSTNQKTEKPISTVACLIILWPLM